MFIIGITGGTGAGKTSASRALKSLGAFVMDCDEIYHELLADNTMLRTELDARYGGVLAGGMIDRKRLGEIVWGDPSALLDLNTITHRYVNEEIEQRLAIWDAQGGTVAAIDAIALLESAIREKCDIVVGVTAPADIRLSRIMKRDGLSLEQAEMRMSAQKSAEFYKENCDYLLEGICDTSEEFEARCKDFFEDLLSKI